MNKLREHYLYVPIPNFAKHIPEISENTIRLITSRAEFAKFTRKTTADRTEILLSPDVIELVRDIMRRKKRKRRR